MKEKRGRSNEGLRRKDKLKLNSSINSPVFYVHIQLHFNSKYVFKGNVMPNNSIFYEHNEEMLLINVRGMSQKC